MHTNHAPILAIVLTSVSLAALGTNGCQCGDDPAPAVQEAPMEAPLEAPTTPPPTPVAPVEAAPAPIGDVSTPEGRWRETLSFDAGGRDLSIASYALVPEPALARASNLALRFCHGDDPVGSVLALGLAATIDSHPHETRAALRCGQRVAEHVPEGSRIHVIEIDRASPLVHVLAIATDLSSLDAIAASLPAGHAEVLGGTAIHCVPFDPGSCADRNDPSDHAMAIVDGHLVSGSYVVLARLLSWDARPRLFALLRRMTLRLTEQPDVEVDFLAPEGRWTIGPRRWLPYALNDAADSLAETVREDARAVAWEHGMHEGLILIEPRCTDAACPEAETLRTALRDYHATWRIAARERMSSLLEGASMSECERDEETAWVTALRDASITGTDTLSLLTYAVPTPADPRCAEAHSLAIEGAAARVHDVLGDP